MRMFRAVNEYNYANGSVAKLGYAGVNLCFLIFAPKHRFWVLVRTASANGSNMYPQSENLCFEQKKKKDTKRFLLKKLFLQLKNSLYIAWACFRNWDMYTHPSLNVTCIVPPKFTFKILT